MSCQACYNSWFCIIYSRYQESCFQQFHTWLSTMYTAIQDHTIHIVQKVCLKEKHRSVTYHWWLIELEMDLQDTQETKPGMLLSSNRLYNYEMACSVRECILTVTNNNRHAYLYPANECQTPTDIQFHNQLSVSVRYSALISSALVLSMSTVQQPILGHCTLV